MLKKNALKIGVLRKRRVKLRLTQRELAERCSFSTSYIYQIENGLKTPSIAALKSITKALRMSMKEVWAD